MSFLETLPPDLAMVVRCAVNMAIGGVFALYVRFLYRRFGTTVSNREQFSSIFPMLTLVTVVIIFVVKSSLALSLGLVGALSIVRFRAAIKTPEELVYLFFCIGIGVALGAEHRLLAVVAVAIISAFVVGKHWLLGRERRDDRNLLLTVSGEASAFFDKQEKTLFETLERLASGVQLERFDLDGGQVQFRANVTLKETSEVTGLMHELQKTLPELHVSYVNLDSVL